MTSTTARALGLSTLLLLSGCPGTAATPDGGLPPSDTGGPADAGPGADAGPMLDTGAHADAPTDAGPGPGLGGGPGIRYLMPGRPIDLTPDGTLAVVEDPGTAMGDVYFFDVDSGELTLETVVGDPARDFSTAISASRRLTAHHGVPVMAGAFTEAGGWLDLGSPFGAGCDQDIASAWDVSADGTIVAGMAWDVCSPAAVRWTIAADDTVTTTTLDRLGVRAAGGSGPPTNRATVISDDGTVIAGFAENDLVDRWPAVWRADGTGFLLPGTVPDAPGEVLSISADGRVVGGTWNLEAFLWSEADGVVSLGRLPTSFGGDTAYANAIAADGALVFGGCGGFGASEAFVWTETGGMRLLTEILTAEGIEIPFGYLFQNVLAASTDGTVILGSVATASGTPQSFVLRLPLSAYGL